jgi:SAM-dependent methyltransferase
MESSILQLKRVPSLSFVDQHYNEAIVPVLSAETMTTFGSNSIAAVYGELTTSGAINMFKKLSFMDFTTKTFVDLGCGLGRVLCAAKLYGFNHVIGVEIAHERAQAAQDMINELAITTPFSEQLLNIQIINNDLFKMNLTELKADVVYVSNLCFTAEMNDLLGQKLNDELTKGTVVFTTRPIELPSASLISTVFVKQSWTDKSILYMYEMTA